MVCKTAAALSALALSGLTVATAPAASADTPGCVTRTEYRSVQRGWTMEHVHRVFDTKGSLSYSGYGLVSRDYKPCAKYAYVSVDYERRNGVFYVDGKSAYWA
jgi:hypothetical protein